MSPKNASNEPRATRRTFNPPTGSGATSGTILVDQSEEEELLDDDLERASETHTPSELADLEREN